jgi:membrane protein DedA with SNARE-associated domain/membrane-associated phospholipid phosphatase
MSEADFQPLLEWLKLNPNWLLFSIFFISFVESLALAGIIVPGVLMLFLVASVAGHLDYTISSILVCGFLGAILGDGISFYLGRHFKDSIPKLWPFSRYPDTLAMGEIFFHKHGGKSVMLGRFIGPIRPVLPLIAGMLGMSQTRFAAFNSASALIWAPFYLLPGYLTGKAASWQLPSGLLTTSIVFISLFILFAWGFRFLSMRLQADTPIYDALLIKQQSSVPLQKIQQHYQKFREHHPHFEFPLASITLLLINLCIFFIWSHLSINTDMLLSINQACIELAQSLRTEMGSFSQGITQLAVHLTLLGDEAFLYVSFILLIILMVTRKHYYAVIHLVIAGLLTALITHALKQYFGISRPDITFNTPASFAYPSGHSSGATVFYALIASFIAQEMANKQRWKCYLSFSLPILLIALSRVVLGVHWLTDVVAGISLGLIISSVTRICYSYFYIKDAKKTPNTKTDKKRILIALFVWMISVIIYQWWFLDITLTSMKIKI